MIINVCLSTSFSILAKFCMFFLAESVIPCCFFQCVNLIKSAWEVAILVTECYNLPA